MKIVNAGGILHRFETEIVCRTIGRTTSNATAG
jgi:hypothetical protein